jgi:hypothetical protein
MSTNGASSAARVKLTLGEGWFLLEKGPRTFLGRVAGFDDEETEEQEPATTEEPAEEPEDEGYPSDFALAPCYEVRRVIAKNAQGQDGVVIVAEPYFYFGDIEVPVTICSPDVIVDVADLGENDRAILVHCVKLGESSRTASRAARSGLAMPGR